MTASLLQRAKLEAVRARIAALETGADHGVLPFGDARLDRAFPGGGLPLGRWHEAGGVDRVAGRRLQLACEKHGATGFVIRRRPYGGAAPREATGSAAASRWKVHPALSQPAPGEPGLGVPRWRATLERCRGGRTGE